MPVTWQKGFSVDGSGGSFNTVSLNANIRMGDEDHRNMFSYSHQTSDGYRVQTQMRRDIASWETLIKAGPKQTLHAYILYGDLFYQTPGALTLAEYMKDPRMARPPVGTQPGAVEAQAAIYQKNFTAGFSNEYRFSEHFQNTTAVYGAYTDFTNPGIRVYEIRRGTPHFGRADGIPVQNATGNQQPATLNGGAEAQRELLRNPRLCQ